jgi:hypothetical protein
MKVDFFIFSEREPLGLEKPGAEKIQKCWGEVRT